MERIQVAGNDGSRKANGFKVVDGNADDDRGGNPKMVSTFPYGNIRSLQDFNDFKPKLGATYPKEIIVGFYLRDFNEIQVVDSMAKELDFP